jgi:hypothetical protein
MPVGSVGTSRIEGLHGGLINPIMTFRGKIWLEFRS